MTGSALSIPTGRIQTGPEVAATACGINANINIDSARCLYRDIPHFGPADVVSLSGGGLIRTYSVDRSGVILRSTFQNDQPGAPIVLSTISTDLTSTVPAADMFSNDSLARSYVPEKYKTGPFKYRWARDLLSPR